MTMVLSAGSSQRVVVARFPNGGIGDHLSCLIGAWWFAKRTGRTLIIDWRGSRFNRDPESGRNCFRDFFEGKDNLAGVPAIDDDRVGRLELSGPFFPLKWKAENFRGIAHVCHTSEEIREVNALVTSTNDRSEPCVVFNQWIAPPPFAEMRLLLDDLVFTSAIRNAASAIWNDQIGSKAGIAVHIRHGNGENIGRRAAHWLGPLRHVRQELMNHSADIHRPGAHGRFSDNMPHSMIRTDNLKGSELIFLRRVRKHVHRMQRKLSGAIPIFFCDSIAVANSFCDLMPDAVVPPKTFLAPNTGPLHAIVCEPLADESDHPVQRIGFEMAVEMELMRRCSALVCIYSGFSIIPRVMLEPSRIHCLRSPVTNRLLSKLIRIIYRH
jgi:hypothetical protein